MDIAYLHLITNHIPIVGVPLAVFLLLLGIWRKSDELKMTALLILVLLGIATLGTFLLGQGGEDFVEDLAGVSDDSIHEHEDFAKLALGSVLVTAVLSFFALIRFQGFSFLRRRSAAKEGPIEGEVSAVDRSVFPTWIVFAVLALALLSSGMLGYTGKLGGKIRHTEFYGGGQNTEEKDDEKHGANGQDTAQPNSESETGEKEKDKAGTESGKGRGRNRGGR